MKQYAPTKFSARNRNNYSDNKSRDPSPIDKKQSNVTPMKPRLNLNMKNVGNLDDDQSNDNFQSTAARSKYPRTPLTQRSAQKQPFNAGNKHNFKL